MVWLDDVAAATAAPTQTPGMVSATDRLAPPPTVYPPTPADQGAQVYYYYCMTCHGDRGQGLTEEFRQYIGPPDTDCWKSNCHGPHHPPDGFVFPHYVPAVIGSGALTNFQTGLQLHDFIQAKMPYQAPGSLTEEKYWQLTAFLLRGNGIDPGRAPLTPERAAQLNIGTPSTATAAQAAQRNAGEAPARWILAGAGLVVLALGLVFAFVNLKRSR